MDLLCFDVKGQGLTGPQWLEKFKSKGFSLSDQAKRAIISEDFISCEKDKIYHIVVVPGQKITFNHQQLNMLKASIYGNMHRLNWGHCIPTGIGCLLGEKFKEKMVSISLTGFVVMHYPIKNFKKKLSFLLLRNNQQKLYLDLHQDTPINYRGEKGFIFLGY